MIYIDILIILIITILCYLIKDYQKILSISSIIMIILGYIVLLLSSIVTKFIKTNLININTQHLLLIVKKRFINRGLILILIGGLEVIIYTIIKLKRRIIKQ